MTKFEEREKAFENHFHHKVDVNLAIKAKAYKMLGFWAAGLLGITNQEGVVNYAMELVIFEYDPSHQGTAIDKLMQDFAHGNLNVSRFDIEDKLEECKRQASAEIMGE